MKYKIEKGLSRFFNLVRTFERHLKEKYNLDDIPYNHAGINFPSAGLIYVNDRKLSYKFHGSGCLIKDGLINLDYHINPMSANKIGVSLFYFTTFIQSYNDDNELNSVNASAPFLIEEQFELLVKDGCLKHSECSKGIYELVEDKIGIT